MEISREQYLFSLHVRSLAYEIEEVNFNPRTFAAIISEANKTWRAHVTHVALDASMLPLFIGNNDFINLMDPSTSPAMLINEGVIGDIFSVKLVTDSYLLADDRFLPLDYLTFLHVAKDRQVMHSATLHVHHNVRGLRPITL